jgi:hypothetical protein
VARRPTLNVPSHARSKAALHRRMADDEKANGATAKHAAAGREQRGETREAGS